MPDFEERVRERARLRLVDLAETASLADDHRVCSLGMRLAGAAETGRDDHQCRCEQRQRKDRSDRSPPSHRLPSVHPSSFREP